MTELPEGTVTFLFTDIEGSTRLLHELGERYADALLSHRRVLRKVFAGAGGVEFGAEGDALFLAFADARAAAMAAQQAQAALAGGPIRVRIGLHTGEPAVVEGDYVGIDVHRVARICAAGHGGQIVLSERTRSLLDEGFEIRDLGLHMLKDLTEPAKLFQLGNGEFPALRSRKATNLPARLSGLIGRSREVADLLALANDRRLITLTGPGGAGKTSLVLEVGAELAEQFADGVFWVPLESVRDPDLVLPGISDALGAQVPLEEHIRERHMLLLLDNLEQVLPASPRLAELLERCPSLHLLVTSRAPLRIDGECEYEVKPLADADAVALFRERAVASEPEEAVTEICRRVDRLPLAIELAAARTRIFPPEQLLERLELRLPVLTTGRRDLPARHRTLRATIEWSHELLSSAEQELFAALAVFVGGFDFDAAEAVVGAAPDALERLVEGSLVKQRAGWFSMLETIREYAYERLTSSVEFETRREQHARYYCAVAERAAGGFEGDDPADSLRRLTSDDENIRAALAWTIEEGAGDDALRVCIALRSLWETQCRLEEGVRWFERALSRPAGTDLRLRASGLRECGRLALFANRHADALGRHYESVALARRLQDPTELAASLRALGAALAEIDGAAARSVLEESLDLSTRAGDRPAQRAAVHNLGEILRDAGQYDEGADLLRRSIALSQELGSSLWVGQTTHSLADLELDRGDLDQAASLYRECLGNAVLSGLERHKVYCIAGLAAIAARRGHDDLAMRLWQGVQRAEQTLDFRLLTGERRRYERYLEHLRVPESGAPSLDVATALAFEAGP